MEYEFNSAGRSAHVLQPETFSMATMSGALELTIHDDSEELAPGHVFHSGLSDPSEGVGKE
jgi:hypothetical protein